jgi:hypothetical protein
VGPRAGLDMCGKSRPTGIRSPDLPDRSESLNRLRYPGSPSSNIGTLFYLTTPTTTLLRPFRQTAASSTAFWAIPFPVPTRFASCIAVNRLKRFCSLRLTKVLEVSAFGLQTRIVSDVVDCTLKFYS